jgi:hypothetical protein
VICLGGEWLVDNVGQCLGGMGDLSPSWWLIGQGCGGPKESTKPFDDWRKLDLFAEFLMVDRVAQALADLTIGDSASDGALIEVLVESTSGDDDGAQKLSWAEQVGAASVEERLVALTLLKLLLSLLERLVTFVRPWC